MNRVKDVGIFLFPFVVSAGFIWMLVSDWFWDIISCVLYK